MADRDAESEDAAHRDAEPEEVCTEVFSVVTYNILSSALASPEWFPFCDPANLESQTRLGRVVSKLKSEINRRAIICLQEVSRDWSGKLHALFQQNGYSMIDSLYGIAISGYMGVCIAFPNEKWTAVDVDISRVADTKHSWQETTKREWRSTTEVRAGDWLCPACGANVFAGKTACFRCHTPKPEAKPAPEPAAGPIDGLVALWKWLSHRCATTARTSGDTRLSADEASSIASPTSASAQASQVLAAAWTPVTSGTSGTSGSQAETPAWYEAARRKENTMVAVHLRSTRFPQLTLWCGTYHMPCAFETPKLMTMHAALAMQHLQRLAAVTSAPCILGGDWNIKPADAAYALLTTASMDPKLAEGYPAVPKGDAWLPTLRCAMRSAYEVAHGQEPDFTNYAQSLRDAAPFIGCLDYVFCSPHLRVLGAPPLPHRQDYMGAGPMPTSSEPSDHLLLSVELELPSQPDPAHADAYDTTYDTEPPAASATHRPVAAKRAAHVAASRRSAREEADARFETAKRQELEAFVGRAGETVLNFPASLTSYQRRVIHALAEELGLRSSSHGEGRSRFICVEKQPFSGEGRRLVGDGEPAKADASLDDVRAARLAALEKRHQTGAMPTAASQKREN